jgi:hypothetical protein
MDPARIFAAVPDAALGLTFLITWFAPSALGPHMLRYAMLTMVLEFIVIHSSSFMGSVALGDASRPRKVATLAVLAAFYSVFLLAFGWILGEWWPAWAFWGLSANRMLGVILTAKPTEQARQEAMPRWAVSTAAYLLWVIGTSILPVPSFGIDAAAIASAEIRGTGLWVEQPARLMAAAAGYFLTQAYAEITNYQFGLTRSRA